MGYVEDSYNKAVAERAELRSMDRFAGSSKYKPRKNDCDYPGCKTPATITIVGSYTNRITGEHISTDMTSCDQHRGKIPWK